MVDFFFTSENCDRWGVPNLLRSPNRSSTYSVDSIYAKWDEVTKKKDGVSTYTHTHTHTNKQTNMETK